MTSPPETNTAHDKRSECIRQSQAARRKRLNIKTITVEVDKETHRKIRQKADEQQSTMQDMLSSELKSIANSEPHTGERPWSVFKEPVSATSNNGKLTHVSLFSGCGGVDLGFHQAGFKTIFANDINLDACETYRKNIGPISSDDIRVVNIPKLKSQPDVLTAGFPCQPFSNAGSRKGLEDERGVLYQTAIDFVSHLKPKCVVFENVRGLLSFKLENGKLLIGKMCEQLDSLGYDVMFSLINASHHHVPQKRLRVFIIGVEKKAKGFFSFPSPVERSDLTLEHTILDLKGHELNQSELMKLNPQALHIGTMVPEGGSWKSIPYEKLPLRLQKISDNMAKYRWPNFYRRFHRNEVAGTITAAFKPENAGVWHPTEDRIFSVREIARIQSFPDWFSFEGKNIKSKYQQIGNAVPPRLAYSLALQIKRTLKGDDLRDSDTSLSFDQFVKVGKPLRACDKDIIFSSAPVASKTRKINQV